jgi:hypothetical protein
MPEKLDKNVILALLAQADSKWFNSHRGPMDYREHLEFTAEYIAKNYNKEAKK